MGFLLYLQLAAGSLLLALARYVYVEWITGGERRRIIQENGCKPIKRVPSKDPFFGLDLIYDGIGYLGKHCVLEKTAESFERNGDTTSIKLLNINAILTIEPEIIKTILATNFKDFELGNERKKALWPLFGHGIFTSDGTAWEHSRAMLRPNFARAQVGDLPTFERHVEQLIKTIPHDGETVDLQPLFFSLTIDSSTEFLFGKSCNSLDPQATDSTKAFAAAFDGALDGLNRREMYGWVSKIFKNRKMENDIKTVHNFVDIYVRDALSHHLAEDVGKPTAEDKRYIFLNELVKDTQDPVLLRSESLNVMLAGRDTTASLLSNFWFVLARRPDIWAKLRAEVDELGGKAPNYQQLKDMKYLRYCLNESLRTHPVVPANGRTAVRDTILPLGGGEDGRSPALVEKGTRVAYSIYAMHRREDIYGSDADEFRPERWEKLRPSWEYLPFNGGPRICLGRKEQLALTEASYTTVRLMQAFKSVESRDPEPWTEKLLLTVSSLNGTKVSLTTA